MRRQGFTKHSEERVSKSMETVTEAHVQYMLPQCQLLAKYGVRSPNSKVTKDEVEVFLSYSTKDNE